MSAELDRPGRQTRVLRPVEARGDVALDADDELAPDAARRRVGLRIVGLVDDDLGDPVAVAEVEEDQLAVVAAAVDPARQTGRDPGVGGPEGAAGMGPVGRRQQRGGASGPGFGRAGVRPS